MSERRILYDNRLPYVVYSSGVEGTLPFFACWEDGSVYHSYATSETTAHRRFTGPVFDVPVGTWVKMDWTFDEGEEADDDPQRIRRPKLVGDG